MQKDIRNLAKHYQASCFTYHNFYRKSGIFGIIWQLTLTAVDNSDNPTMTNIQRIIVLRRLYSIDQKVKATRTTFYMVVIYLSKNKSKVENSAIQS